MVKKKRKTSLLRETVREGRISAGLLKHGERSKLFQDFLKRYDLDIPRPKETGDIIQDIKNSIIWREQRAKYLEMIIDYYKSTYARGMQILDEIIQLDTDILKRTKYLESQGIDPLTDKDLMEARKQKFEMMKYLDKIKFEKDKFVIEQKTKDASSSNPSNDKMFVVDIDYDLVDKVDNNGKVQDTKKSKE